MNSGLNESNLKEIEETTKEGFYKYTLMEAIDRIGKVQKMSSNKFTKLKIKAFFLE